MKHTQSAWGPRRGAVRGEKEEKGGCEERNVQEEQMSLNCKTLGKVLGLQLHARLE